MKYTVDIDKLLNYIVKNGEFYYMFTYKRKYEEDIDVTVRMTHSDTKIIMCRGPLYYCFDNILSDNSELRNYDIMRLANILSKDLRRGSKFSISSSENLIGYISA